MKKTGFILSAILLLSIFSIFFISPTIAALPTDNLENQVNDLNQNLQNIPTSPEQIKERYLTQEWNKIAPKIPIFGVIHNFLVANPVIFQFLMHETYSFSLTFFLILFLWCFSILLIKNLVKSKFNKGKGGYAWLIGLGGAIALAWASATKGLALLILYYVYAQETLLSRAILWLVVIGVLIGLYYVDSMLASNIKKSREEAEKNKMKQDIAETQAFVKGAKRALNS